MHKYINKWEAGKALLNNKVPTNNSRKDYDSRKSSMHAKVMDKSLVTIRISTSN
jgi:hypothetical protein